MSQDFTPADLHTAFILANDVRAKQKTYFANRSGDNLMESKRAEKLYDDHARKMLTGPDLLSQPQQENQ